MRRAGGLAWLALATGAFLAHGIPLLLVEGQVALALASDPFGRGWDLFGTADRAVDFSPLSPGVVGAAQLSLAMAGGIAGVVAAAGTLRPRRGGPAVAARSAVAALWVLGVSLAGATAAVVAVVTTDLE